MWKQLFGSEQKKGAVLKPVQTVHAVIRIEPYRFFVFFLNLA